MLKNTFKTAQKGFTIIELLIVIAIIGILAGLVLNNFQGAQAKARDTQRKTDTNNMHSKLEEFYNEEGNYPGELNTTNLAGIDEGSLTDTDDVSIAVTLSAAATVPTEPYTATKPAASQYSYLGYDCSGVTSSDTCAKYVLFTWLERGGDTYASYSKNSLN